MSFFGPVPVNIFGYMITEEIVTGLKKRDNQSWSYIYDKYYDRLVGVCFNIGVNEIEAEDIIHDAFIKILEKIGDIKNPDLFDRWVCRITANTVFDFLRNRVYVHENDVSELEYLISGNCNYETQFMDKDETLKVLSCLPERMAKVIELYDLEGYNHDEIGNILNISAGTSKSQLKRARDKCRERIEGWRGTASFRERTRRPQYNNKEYKGCYMGKHSWWRPVKNEADC